MFCTGKPRFRLWRTIKIMCFMCCCFGLPEFTIFFVFVFRRACRSPWKLVKVNITIKMGNCSILPNVSRYRECPGMEKQYPEDVGKQHHVGSEEWGIIGLFKGNNQHTQRKHGDDRRLRRSMLGQRYQRWCWSQPAIPSRKWHTIISNCAGVTNDSTHDSVFHYCSETHKAYPARLSCEWIVSDSIWLANVSWSMQWHTIMTLDNAPNDALQEDFTRLLEASTALPYGRALW